MEVGEIFNSVPLTRYHWVATAVLFFAFAIEAWEFLIPSFLLPTLMPYFRVGTGIGGTLISAPYFGALLGAYGFAPLTDRIGRKKSIMYGLLGYGIANAFTAVASPGEWPVFFVARFVAGFFIIMVMVQPFAMLEEFLPTRSRGRVTTYLASGWPAGTLLAVAAVYFVLPVFSWQGAMLVSSAMALVYILPVYFLLDETPYYLVGSGRQSEAKNIIKKLSAGKVSIDDGTELYTVNVRRGSMAELFRPELRRPTILILLANVTFSLGYWGLFAWLPTILVDRGISFLNTLLYIAIGAIAEYPGYLAAAYLEEKKSLGRKWVMAIFLAASGAATFWLAYSFTFNDVMAAIIILSFFNLGAWGVWDAWQPELYPSNIRGTLMGWVGGAQRISNSIAPFMFGFLVAAAVIGFTGVIVIVAVSLWLTVIFIYYLKETLNVPLDEAIAIRGVGQK
ncbi:MFS transporter [Thermogymnomonas acidicola]|uniref:MFS transporter n=1 Tax=Thermogymnomonas acidicola TaxID=399579 RepID=A0AA37FA00_9ARCH|nr:MFS transporter [Thermogymnomonas acidicola]